MIAATIRRPLVTVGGSPMLCHVASGWHLCCNAWRTSMHRYLWYMSHCGMHTHALCNIYISMCVCPCSPLQGPATAVCSPRPLPLPTAHAVAMRGCWGWCLVSWAPCRYACGEGTSMDVKCYCACTGMSGVFSLCMVRGRQV